MIQNFKQVEDRIHSYPTQKIAVASGTDSETLHAVAMAREKNIAECVLAGDERVIRETGQMWIDVARAVAGDEAALRARPDLNLDTGKVVPASFALWGTGP